MDLSFLERDYTIPSTFVYLFVVFSMIIFVRYVILSGLYQRLIYDRMIDQYPERINSPKYPKNQRTREILWSFISSTLFGLVGVLMIMAWKRGYTAIYVDWQSYPLWYVPISFIAALLLHDTYYYWVHRWLHHPKVYKYVHRVHHESVDTSVWTSFSFHPIESVLQAIIIPLIVLVIPMHAWVLLIHLMIMTATAIINHAGAEIYPSSWKDNRVMKWLIGSTHHDLHHRKFTKNYGLYFTFWDICMGTESDKLDKRRVKTNPQREVVEI